MRTEQENLDVKEASFKTSKISKKKGKQQEKEHRSNIDVLKDDEEVANFVKRLNKGTDGRNRGNIPLICFNSNGIGQFSNKCPHKKKRNDEGYSKKKKKHIKAKEPQIKFSRKSYAPKKTSHHPMKMKSVTV
jgi:hypothetical protein